MSGLTSNYIKGILGVFLLMATFVLPREIKSAVALNHHEQLGKSLFFDASLSQNGNQSCATCHDPATGYTGSVSEINAHGAIYPGSNPSKSDSREPTTVAYLGDIPELQYNSKAQTWVGGIFSDRHITSKVRNDPLAEQAMESFLNPREMALVSAEQLCNKVASGKYVELYEQVWGKGSLNCSNASAVYSQIGKSIAAYERSEEVSSYTSKFDQFWSNAWNKNLNVSEISINNWKDYRDLGLNNTELYGLAVFNDPKGANCAACHSLRGGSNGYPLFTNYRYANVGMPGNSENPFHALHWVDNGLGEYLRITHPESATQEMGKMRVPTLRNVDKRPSADFVKAYGHSGYFKSLDEVVRFYASRGTLCGGMSFPPAEVSQNLAAVNSLQCGDRKYIVSFLKTLSDGYFQR